MKFARLSVFLALPLMFGCAAATAPPVPLAPGAVNSFDQTSYAALLTAQASYNSLLASYTANPTALSALKAPLDAAATAINGAEAAWKVYHAAAVAGNVTTAQQTSVTTALSAAQTAIAGVHP